ncbi:NUDIX hydrolase [Vibrio gazogenes]|uniref:GDP-mannose pyrophosphatase n=1 Tax=Vibrio gazogenes DSM 21264 = NBRC 103151 TaxID=1123492 RepID=A0A1M4VKR3_VIBGA|nr:NUDIX hydrolase [Vibrio gazogenes]USP15520.1 NUDIX hydrolase [Vibrio gazogenes]SHE69470.1 ADP-ribose pyrophosphatase [Vibrio gazogenes DSM 21264] [Vibrio gazogenes DSM 21264 = NBRC 103151]SJN57373.1 ADP-ribose pyrophosphatase [Vibrio gazogenes]
MRKTIHQWKQISLVEEEVMLPTHRPTLHTTIIHPGAAVILPVNQQGEIVMLRQFRPSIRKWLLELPAGTREVPETPLACAQRELAEETGYLANEWVALGQLTPLAGFCDEIQHLFVAKDLSVTQDYQRDDDEVIEIFCLSVQALEKKIIDGEITDTKTIACLSKAKLCGYI